MKHILVQKTLMTYVSKTYTLECTHIFNYLCVHSTSLGFSRGFAWSHLVSHGFSRFHLVWLGLTWQPLVALGFIWFHLVSLSLTRSHLVSLCLNWTHLISLGLTWSHLATLGPTLSHLVSLGVKMEKGKSLSPKGKREMPTKTKGKRERPQIRIRPGFDLSYKVRARTHARHKTLFVCFGTVSNQRMLERGLASIRKCSQKTHSPAHKSCIPKRKIA